MRRILLGLILLITATLASSQYQVMGFYPQSIYGDYIIVYSYYASNGQFVVSHCRTNKIDTDLIYSNNTYLDIENCRINYYRRPLPLDTSAGM